MIVRVGKMAEVEVAELEKRRCDPRGEVTGYRAAPTSDFTPLSYLCFFDLSDSIAKL